MRTILLLSKGLARGGAEQLLVNAAPYGDASRFRYEVAYLLPELDAVAPDLRRAGFRVTCIGGAQGTRWMARLRRLVHERRIDLVHAHSPYAAIGARLALRRRDVRLVYTEHNVWESYHRATYWGNLLTYFRNDHVFAVSDQVRRSARYPRTLRFLPMPPVEVLYHGIDPAAREAWGSSDGVRAELGIPEGVPVVGMVGSFKPQKDHRTLLRAMERVLRRVPETRLVLVGDGPLLDGVRDEARDMGLDGAVIFTGHREDAPRIAGAVDVYVMSSAYEGLSIALVEAMALGRPVVVTRAGGLQEVVEPGRQGLVVPPGDHVALADGIVSLLVDDGLREQFGAAARARAADFDIRKAVRRLEQVYLELLER